MYTYLLSVQVSLITVRLKNSYIKVFNQNVWIRFQFYERKWLHHRMEFAVRHEPYCGALCQHPTCWEAHRREERGLLTQAAIETLTCRPKHTEYEGEPRLMNGHSQWYVTVSGVLGHSS